MLNESITQIYYDSEPFLLFNRYGYKVKSAVGEFPYNVFSSEEKWVREYISPPEMWIYERSNGKSIDWFLGKHISRKELQDTLGEQLSLPYKGSLGAIQPTGFISPAKILIVALFAAFALGLTHLLTMFTLENRVIVEGSYQMDSAETKTFVTDKFTLRKSRSNLEFDIQAPVSNSWFELNATLVDAKTGTEYNIEKGIEFYHGTSDGESWMEGGTQEHATLDEIPSGTYYLQVSGTREPGQLVYPDAEIATKFSLTVVYDSANNSNFWYCLLGVLVLPLCQFLWVRYNEERRWANSPFAPNNE